MDLTTSGTIISANGSVVAGNIDGGLGTTTPYQWINGTLIHWPSDAAQTGTAIAVSPDGSVVVGSVDSFDPQPYEWTNAGVTLLNLPSDITAARQRPRQMAERRLLVTCQMGRV